MIKAKIVADSVSAATGDRLTTMLITLPRILLSELNTHRMLSKNSASSRAIPFKKMVESVKTNPFIPIAWQRDHSGMQGTEYIRNVQTLELVKEEWLAARDNAILSATRLHSGKIASDEDLQCDVVTKQLCNRLLEPFMYHTVLISGTEWENFFSLRCPQYETIYGTFRSIKDARESELDITDRNPNIDILETPSKDDVLGCLSINKGQAEIHIMALAEAMWDAMNESKPVTLNAGDWHIPFEDKMADDFLLNQPEDSLWAAADKIGRKIKISTAMAARTSYTVVGDEKEVSYDKLVEIHDRMANQVPFHASPFEHCARVMDSDEYELNVKGEVCLSELVDTFRTKNKGWCRNYKGFIQYRHIIESSRIS